MHVHVVRTHVAKRRMRRRKRRGGERKKQILPKRAPPPAAENPALDLEQVRSRCDEDVALERLYLPFSKIGLPLQPRFRTVRNMLSDDSEVI